MNFTQQTELLHVFMPPVAVQRRWWGSGHHVPSALLQQVLQHPQCPCEGDSFTLHCCCCWCGFIQDHIVTASTCIQTHIVHHALSNIHS